MRYLFACSFLFLASGLTQPAAAVENWPQWRGPNANGVAADGEYPVDFSSQTGVEWKVALPGPGTSTPAVWDDRIFVTCQIGQADGPDGVVDGKDGVVCYGMDGSEIWRRELGPGRPPRNRAASGSNPSPVTDGQHVVVYFKSGTVACFDLDGNQKWKLNLQQRYGEDTLLWDLGTSPVLAGDRVIIAVMQEGDSYLVALDLASGQAVWKQSRMYDCAWESDQSYTTPHIVEIDGRDVLVTWGADHLTGHDVDTGALLWECGSFNPERQRAWRTIASAAINSGIAVLSYGRGDFLAGVRLGGEGDITDSNRLWEKRGAWTDAATPATDGGKVYVLTDRGRDRGKITCLDVESGDEIWSARLPRHSMTYYASPVLAGDMLYCTREDGVIFVGRVSEDGFELLAENDMGETLIATPIPLRNGLLIRGEEHLFRIGSN